MASKQRMDEYKKVGVETSGREMVMDKDTRTKQLLSFIKMHFLAEIPGMAEEHWQEPILKSLKLKINWLRSQ